MSRIKSKIWDSCVDLWASLKNKWTNASLGQNCYFLVSFQCSQAYGKGTKSAE